MSDNDRVLLLIVLSIAIGILMPGESLSYFMAGLLFDGINADASQPLVAELVMQNR